MAINEEQINDLLESAFEAMMRDMNKEAARYGLSLTQIKWNKETKKVEFETSPFEDMFKPEPKGQ